MCVCVCVRACVRVCVCSVCFFLLLFFVVVFYTWPSCNMTDSPGTLFSAFAHRIRSLLSCIGITYV